MQSQRKVSIVIPCYNDHLYVEQALDSALSQTWPNKEVIVVNDGSNDQTKQKLKSLSHKIDKLINQNNQGVSAARNTGIRAANGDFILVLDSDDFYEKKFCEKAISEFDNNSNVKLVSCYAKWFDKRGYKHFKPSGGKVEDFLLKNCALGVMYRKKDFENVGCYDEEMLKGYEDWELYIRLLKDGGEAKIIPETLFNYRNRKNSRNKKANDNKFEIQEYIFNKHSNLYKKHFALFINKLLETSKKNELYKNQIKDSTEYRIGLKLLKPFRSLGILKKNFNSAK